MLHLGFDSELGRQTRCVQVLQIGLQKQGQPKNLQEWQNATCRGPRSQISLPACKMCQDWLTALSIDTNLVTRLSQQVRFWAIYLNGMPLRDVAEHEIVHQ